MAKWEAIQGDCLEVMRGMADDSVDLVFCSPPYEAARTYGIDFKLKGQAWADWSKERFLECVRISKGLVAWVVEGQTRQFKYSSAPILLMADLHRAGVTLRKPAVFHRVGIPGSGGPDWLRNDYEFVVCGTAGGKLPWSDNTACGHSPKWAPGGDMSHRLSDGTKRNQWGHSGTGTNGHRTAAGERKKASRPSHVVATVASMREKAIEPKAVAFVNGEMPAGSKLHTKNDGDSMRVQCYLPPVKANPGNVLNFKVGGGLMGHKLAHENEAPYPLGLAEFFVKSFCPPGGTVLDPFGGSGTTMHAAVLHGRNSIAIDVRESQIELMKRRMADVEKAGS